MVPPPGSRARRKVALNPAHPDPPQTIRAFVALALPGAWKDRLRELQEQLRQELGNPGGFRWADTSQVHLTVKFLGDIAAEVVPQVQDSLAKAAAESGPFELGAAGFGFFPDHRRPRVCWVGLEGDLSALRSLWERVDRATEPWVPREKRPFSPHLTLARVREVDRGTTERLLTLREALCHWRLGSWTVTGMDFMRSELLPHGARHTRLAALPLASVPL